MIQKEHLPISQHQNQDQLAPTAEERRPTMHHLPGGRENRLTHLNHPLVKRFRNCRFQAQKSGFLVGDFSKKANLPTLPRQFLVPIGDFSNFSSKLPMMFRTPSCSIYSVNLGLFDTLTCFFQFPPAGRVFPRFAGKKMTVELRSPPFGRF